MYVFFVFFNIILRAFCTEIRVNYDENRTKQKLLQAECTKEVFIFVGEKNSHLQMVYNIST